MSWTSKLAKKSKNTPKNAKKQQPKPYYISKWQPKGPQFLHLACQVGSSPPCSPSVTPLFVDHWFKWFLHRQAKCYASWCYANSLWCCSEGTKQSNRWNVTL